MNIPAEMRGSRSPLGERGLKYHFVRESLHPIRSLSAWRAWIEIFSIDWLLLILCKSLSAWRAWIEISFITFIVFKIPRRSPLGERGLKLVWMICLTFLLLSLSAWRAWIEISWLYQRKHAV